jgi:hypothetical protein
MRYSPTKTADSLDAMDHDSAAVAAQMRPALNAIRTGDKIPTDDASSLAAGILFAVQAARDPDLQEYQNSIVERMAGAQKRYLDIKNTAIPADVLAKEAVKIVMDPLWLEPTGEKKALNALAPLFTSMHDDRPARSRLLMKRGFEIAAKEIDQSQFLDSRFSSADGTRMRQPFNLEFFARRDARFCDDRRGAKDALNNGDAALLASLRGSAPALTSLADRISTDVS